MTPTRIGINIRVFGLAATLGFAGATEALPRVTSGYLMLCAIAVTFCLVQPSGLIRQAAPVIEAALVGMTLGITGAINQPLGMYLMVPALLAGLIGGMSTVSAAFLVELGSIALVPIVRLNPELSTVYLREMLPWLLTAIGLGLLGSWIRRLRTAPADEDQARYAAASRLLHQLRQVSRGLSAGLDPIVLSGSLLDDCLTLVPDGCGALLVRTQGGAFVALAQNNLDRVPGRPMSDPLVVQCWATVDAAHETPPVQSQHRASAQSAARGIYEVGPTRTALPLRVGTRMVGVLTLELKKPLAAVTQAELQALLDERALRLDSALLFDEVRTHATVEERHRLAREIHDGIAQEIASLGYLVDDLASASDSTARANRVAQVRAELSRIVNDLRLSIFDLRSQVSRSSGLGAVLGEYLREVGSRSTTAVHLSLDESPERLGIEVEEELLRIIQEAVTNARKHASADNLWVSCHVRPPAAELLVEDDGSGLGSDVPAHGFGLSIMRERADRIGATLAVTERPGGGTRVSVSLKPSTDANAVATQALPPVRPEPWRTRQQAPVATCG
ncbi:MAG: sensor histidine kinase [Nocardioidaceae bacterium]|nr:sensor histidine kinase [Nocardioidaceae bacterium]